MDRMQTGASRRGPRWGIIAGAGLVFAGMCLLLWRFSFTPEWVVLTGSKADRQDVCRSIYKKPPWRVSWSLRRLLKDTSPGVRITAIGVLDLTPELHREFVPTMVALTGAQSARVRARSLEFLFQHGGMAQNEWASCVLAELRNAEFREQHPELLSAYLNVALGAENRDAVEWALELIEGGEENEGLRGALSRHPELLRPYRERLVACLGKAGNARKALLVGMLSAVDGQMRGLQPEDWATSEAGAVQVGGPAKATVRFTIEAEWAHSLEPNFQIDVQEGEACISLGEGAGGEHFWRKHAESSVDIGRAHYTFEIPKAGLYQVWCRCWFMDKCGNHSLLHIDDRWLRWRNAGHDDRHDLLQTWHWKALESRVRLSKGRHTVRLTAGDDGLLYDKLAILPAEETFDPDSPPPLVPLHDLAIPPAISISMERQAQSRGMRQVVSAWVRRTDAACRQGDLTLAIPPPFQILGEATRRITFSPGIPVAGADYQVVLPEGSICGEVTVSAVFSEDGKEQATGDAILGANYDWVTTGPLKAGGPQCEELKRDMPGARSDVVDWHAYPVKGYDRYRRLDFEMAYGQHQHAVIFLYTEITVTEAGEYQSFLNLDDCGFVYIDGKRVAGRDEPSVGEGWLLVDRIHLAEGTFPVSAWIYQQAFPEPTGPDAGRHTPNHWNFKWLLRKSQHEPAPAIQGIAVSGME